MFSRECLVPLLYGYYSPTSVLDNLLNLIRDRTLFKFWKINIFTKTFWPLCVIKYCHFTLWKRCLSIDLAVLVILGNCWATFKWVVLYWFKTPQFTSATHFQSDFTIEIQPNIFFEDISCSTMACQALQYCMWKYMCCISKYLWTKNIFVD